ncbi:MAG: type II toxin-antitoxin system VapC family toxin [Anaerolineae bacterium]
MSAPQYVLDTDTVTYLQAGRAAVMRRLSTVSPDAVFTTVITMREQLRGRLAAVDQAAEGPDLLLAYDRLLATVRYFTHVNVLPFSPAAAATLQRLRDQRIRIGTQDLRIAAIVLSTGGTLVTSNRRDFEKVPGLLIEDWDR